MRVAVLSDMHMDHCWSDLNRKHSDDVVYINAGDTHYDESVRTKFADRFGDRYLAINGNHDYYEGNFSDSLEDVFVKDIDGVRIAGATLWTEIRSNLLWQQFASFMNDARFIHDINMRRYNETHDYHKEFIANAEADVVVTHHCPTLLSVHPKYERHGVANKFFSNDLANWLLDMKKPPKLWVCGHTHEAHAYWVADTLVVCNPRGYPGEFGRRPGEYTPLLLDLDNLPRFNGTIWNFDQSNGELSV